MSKIKKILLRAWCKHNYKIKTYYLHQDFNSQSPLEIDIIEECQWCGRKRIQTKELTKELIDEIRKNTNKVIRGYNED